MLYQSQYLRGDFVSSVQYPFSYPQIKLAWKTQKSLGRSYGSQAESPQSTFHMSWPSYRWGDWNEQTEHLNCIGKNNKLACPNLPTVLT